MGQLMGKLAEPLQNCSVSALLVGRRKRKHGYDNGSSADVNKQDDQNSPKKKRLLTTTQYIYQALFKEQKNTDIAVMALGKVWNLHKVYLSQSPYFYSMFNGSWKEATENFVHIKILDERITLDALDAVFGSMYSDEIEIEPCAVVSILATATLFHLDGIIDKCAEVMAENINEETVIMYHDAACQYGCLNVKNSTFKWLEINLLSLHSRSSKLIGHISIELMTDLVASQELYVMQTEFSLYTLLRTWIYLRLFPHYNIESNHQQQHQQQHHHQEEQQLDTQLTQGQSFSNENNNNSNKNNSNNENDPIQTYFSNRKDKNLPFLYTRQGKPYLKPFQALRTQYLINHHTDLLIIHGDNIIPEEWISNHVLYHWSHILKTDHLHEEGPQNLEPEVFNKHSIRCGRILLEPGYQKWRWTGFNFGLDLIFIADSRLLSIRRHHRAEHERLLSLQTKRQFMVRASVTTINQQRQPIFTQTSEILSLCLEKNEEVTLMLMDQQLVHPLLISVNLLVIPPTAQSFKDEIFCQDDLNTSIPISEIGDNIAQRSITPTAYNNTHNGNCCASSDSDSAVCLVPPSPPQQQQLQLNNEHNLVHTFHRPSTSTATRSTDSLSTTASTSSSAFDSSSGHSLNYF